VTGRRGGGRARGAARARPRAAGRRAPLLALLLVLALAGPGVDPSGVLIGSAAAQSGAGADVAPTSPQGRAKADELRTVARDALARDARDGDDGGTSLDLDDSLLGIGGVVWRILLVLLLVLAVVVGVALYRRGPRRRRRAGRAAVAGGDPADDLERQALRAEEAGEHRAAVVLWFRAGTRRLGEALRIRADATATAGQVARASGDPRVLTLAVDHDRAAYGPGPVGADASRGAREGWRAVLREPAGGDRPDAGDEAP